MSAPARIAEPEAADPASRRALRDATDAELLEGLRRSSEPHFSELYDRYFPRIYSYVQRRWADDADVEEIVQEVFLAVFRSLPSYRGDSSLLAWIYGVAKNTLNANRRRAAVRRGKLEQLDPARLEPNRCLVDCTPEEHLILQQVVHRIGHELGELSGWQAEVFDMRHFQNLSISEISQRTHRTSESVRSSLYRMKRLVMRAAEADRGRASKG